MNLLYTRSNTPQTIDEFVQVMQRLGNKSLDIVVTENGKHSLNSIHGKFFEVHYKVRLESDGIKSLKIANYDVNGHISSAKGNLAPILQEIEEKKALRSALGYAMDVAYGLKQEDLEKTINGNSIENANNKYNQCVQLIKKLDQQIPKDKPKDKNQEELFKPNQ